MRHERHKLFPPYCVAVCHHCGAAIHPCRGWMADSGQRDDLSSSVAKLDCLRGCRWTCVDRFRRITPGLSKVVERTERLAQMRCGGLGTRVATPSLVLTAKAFTPIHTLAVAPVAAQGRYHQHADAVCPASWTAPHSYLTGPVARWELAGLAGLRGHAVRLMKRRGRHGLGGSCEGQNKSNSDQPDHCHLHVNLPMTHPIARTKPMGPGLAFVHKRSAH